MKENEDNFRKFEEIREKLYEKIKSETGKASLPLVPRCVSQHEDVMFLYICIIYTYVNKSQILLCSISYMSFVVRYIFEFFRPGNEIQKISRIFPIYNYMLRTQYFAVV